MGDMTIRIGLCGLDSSHSEDFLRHFNLESRHPGIRITALAAGDAQRAAELTAYAPGLIEAADLWAMLGIVDAVIVGHRNGARHREAAVTSLGAGKPVFVDKPLANTLADAEAIVDAAERAGIPLLSASALRYQAETYRIKAMLAGIDGEVALTAAGTWFPDNAYGGPIFYAIHAIELALELMGPDFAAVERARGDDAAIRYRNGANRVKLAFRPPGEDGSTAFSVAVKAGGVRFSKPIKLSDDYMAPVAERFAAMLRSGASGMTRETLLAPIRLMAAIEPLLTPR